MEDENVFLSSLAFIDDDADFTNDNWQQMQLIAGLKDGLIRKQKISVKEGFGWKNLVIKERRNSYIKI